MDCQYEDNMECGDMGKVGARIRVKFSWLAIFEPKIDVGEGIHTRMSTRCLFFFPSDSCSGAVPDRVLYTAAIVVLRCCVDVANREALSVGTFFLRFKNLVHGPVSCLGICTFGRHPTGVFHLHRTNSRIQSEQ